MKLQCPTGVTSINIAGVEYTAEKGAVTINEQQHIDAAMKNGFTCIQAVASEMPIFIESDSTKIESQI